MVAKRKLENDKQMGERNLVGFTLLDAWTERQVRRYNKAQSVSKVNTGANANAGMTKGLHWFSRNIIISCQKA